MIGVFIMRETNERIYFWTARDYYSNFFYSPFKHKEVAFKWSEQAIMWRKAKFFGAGHIAKKILEASTPQECKNLGRSKEIPFNQEAWEKVREEIYYEVLIDKFSVGSFKAKILSTENKMLVEASPYDKIWGCGYAEDDSRIEGNPASWPGLNLLGKVLERVREDLRNS